MKLSRRQFIAVSALAGLECRGAVQSFQDLAFVGQRGFHPTRVANCSLLLDPSGLAALNDGDHIATWPDISGNGRDATQATDANRLIKQTATNGGISFPVARADGTEKSLVTPSFLGAGWNTSFTFICCYAQIGTSVLVVASNAGLVFYAGSSTTQAFNTSGLSDTQISAQYGNWAAWKVRSFRYDGATKTLRVNGINRVAEAATGNLNLSGVLTIGKLSSGGFIFNGDISHIGIWQRALTDPEIFAIEDWMAAQAGIPHLPQVYCEGDSLTQGTCATAGNDYPSLLAGLLGITKWDVTNVGGSGQTLAQMNADTGNLTQVTGNSTAFRRKNIAVVWGGTNDIFVDGQTGIQTAARLATFCSTLRAAGWTVVALTMISRGQFDATMETYRQSFNGLIRGTPGTYCDALCDVDANTPVGGVGTFSNTTYYCGDQVHLNDTGYGIVAEAVNNTVVAL